MTHIMGESKTGWKLDNSYARLPQVFYSKTTPTPVCSPDLVVFNDSLAEHLVEQTGSS